ncbi:MAG: AMP-binding protein, partial [Pseudohongiella sp.]|nr:AMP-binding protein [Pseudohongiella sp.]
MQSNDELLLGQSPDTLLASLPAKVSTPVFERAVSAPLSPAIRDHTGRHFNYAELAESVRQAQQQLQLLGINPGDRVLLINENSVPVLICILALGELGAWPVVVNARMAAAEIDRIRNHCEPRVVIYLLESAAAASHWSSFAGTQHCEQLELAGTSVGVRHLPVSERSSEQALSEQGVFTLIYTTGTTGDPKGVMLTHRNMLYVAAVSGALRGLKSDDKIYLVLPVSHVFGISAVFLAALYAGAELIVADRFDPALCFSNFEQLGVSGVFGVPAMFAKLVDHARERGISQADHAQKWPRLRFMYSGGAPLDPAIKEKTEHLFGLPLLNGYGMTESGPTISQVRFNEPLANCS